MQFRLIGLYPEEDSMGRKYPSGFVKIVDQQQYPKLVPITSHGKKNPLLINVQIADSMNLLEKKRHSIRGWIRVLHLYIFLNFLIMMNILREHIQQQLDLKQRIS